MERRLRRCGCHPFNVVRAGWEASWWEYDTNQLSGETNDPDGRADDPYNDCGPGVLAGYRRTRTRLEGQVDMVAPDTIRDYMYGEGSKGYTYAVDLANAARGMWGYTGYNQYLNYEQTLVLLQTIVPAGGLVMVLSQEPAGYFHWTAWTGWFDDGRIIRHNPYGGYREILSEADARNRFRNSVVVVR